MDALISARDWDERYRTSELIWKAGPNQWVRQYTQDLSPGTALDLASGEGCNAVWLADRGWQVTAADFSAVAMDKAQELVLQYESHTENQLHGPELSQPANCDLVDSLECRWGQHVLGAAGAGDRCRAGRSGGQPTYGAVAGPATYLR